MISSEMRYLYKGHRVIFHYVYITKWNFLWKMLKFDTWFSKTYYGDDYCSVYQYTFKKFYNENEINRTPFMKMLDSHEASHVELFVQKASPRRHLMYDLKTGFGLLQWVYETIN